MKINCLNGAIAAVLVLTVSATACDAPHSVSPRAASPEGPNVTDDVRLAALASADSNQFVDAQLEYATNKSMDDVAQLNRDGNVRIVGLSHAFRYKGQVQVGGFDLPEASSGAEVLAAYRKSTDEFLHGMITSTRSALADESDPVQRQSYIELLQAFKARLSEFDRDRPAIYSIRVRARAGFLVGVRTKDRTVRRVSLPDGSQRGFRIPTLPNDIEPRASTVMQICPLLMAVGGRQLAAGGRKTSVSSNAVLNPCNPPPDPDPVPGPIYSPPPSGQGTPTSDTGIPPNLPLYVTVPISDPYDDDTYFDDFSVNNTYWAPTEGKSYVDFDAYSKFAIEHWLWKFPHLTLYLATNKRFSFEGEVHQDGRNGQPIFANGYYAPNGSAERTHAWDSNFPAAYLDTRFLDRADVPNHTVGTIAPERLQYNTFYYTWIRFSPYIVGASSGKIQVAAQLGDRDGFCMTPNGWCSLTSLSTVRVLPWICGYRAPNRTTMAGRWKRWYYDGVGYKNETCKDVL